MKFFSLPKQQNSLTGFLLSFENLESDDEFEKSRNLFIKIVMNSMINKSEEWDEYCQNNINLIGETFINELPETIKNIEKKEIDLICSSCFRFLYEKSISQNTIIINQLNEAVDFVLYNIDKFDSLAKSQIIFAIYQMPTLILKDIANSKGLDNLKNVNAICDRAETLKSNWDRELQEKEDRVECLSKALSKYENAFNFVGLHQGFDELSIEKNREKKGILFWLRIISIVILLPIMLELLFIYSHLDNISSVKDGLLVAIFPTVSFIIISVYYFRVLLLNYKSVKAQILQIELRKTLCRFIQSYSEYSNGIKTNDANPLDKFENIIFSGIVMDEISLPSAFDGAEQLSKLIKAIKS